MLTETQADEIEEVEEVETEIVEDSSAATTADTGSEDETEPAPIVSFDEDSPPQATSQEEAPKWVKTLRKEIREKDRRIRELESGNRRQPEAPALGPKPTLSDDDVDFDEDKYAAKLEKWVEQKRDHDAKESSKRTEAEKAQQSWKDSLSSYAKQRDELDEDDFEESQFAVEKSLSETQQAIIIQAVPSSAKMVYALGKSPKKLAELATITDPVRFAVEIGKLEAKMGTVAKKTLPAPERSISGSAVSRAVADSKLEKLRAEAQKSGNYTKVLEYKRSLRK